MATALLDAINTLLVARGVTPIIDVNSGHPDVQASKLLLARHKRAVQGRKWWFNTEVDVDLSPNVDGWIYVPANVESLDNDQNYVIMDGKLYNVTTRTNVFTDDVEGLTLIFNRDWADLPVQAYDYIVNLAKEEFIRPLESQILTTEAKNDINRSKALIDIADFRFKDVSMESANPLLLKWRGKMIVR